MKRALGVGAAVFVMGMIPAALAGPDALIHERIPVDPKDDIAAHVVLGVTGTGSPVETPSGQITPPDPKRSPQNPATRPYTAQSRPEAGGGPGATFRPDRDTRRP